MLGLILLVQALSVVIGGPPTSAEYLSIHVAEAEGYFAREGLSVTIRSTKAEPGAAEALAQGQADLAATSLEGMLRFGMRPAGLAPRLVLGLSAAPPVSLLVSNARAQQVRSVKDLAGARIGLTSPGAPEHTWLVALLARARLTPAQVDLRSLGSRGLVTAIELGEVKAGLVPEPDATRLVHDERARRLVDLTSPSAVASALGGPTVNAAVFVFEQHRVPDRDIAAFCRAILAAERRIAAASPATLAERLPTSVTGVDEEFEQRVLTTRAIYLPDGLVSADAVTRTIEIMRAHLPLSAAIRVPPPSELLYLEPLRRALTTGR